MSSSAAETGTDACRIGLVDRRWRDGAGHERPRRWREGAKQHRRHDDDTGCRRLARSAAAPSSWSRSQDELNKPSAGQATDDAGRSETEASDGDDVALDDAPPRTCPKASSTSDAAFDDVIEALSAAYGASERDWLENALERVVRRLPEGRATSYDGVVARGRGAPAGPRGRG